MIKALWDFFRKRSSDNAACVVIDFAQYMSPRDLRGIADYLQGLADDTERRLS